MNPKWSASRFGTWLGCKQKYKLNYIDELVVVGRDAEVTTKGLSFHQIAENMDSSKTEADLYKMAQEVLGTFDFDKEKYPVIKAIPRFYMWWQEYIKKYEDQGYTLYRENWENSKIDDQPLVGAIDVLLINEKTNDVRIYDYKTGSTAKISGYENQLLLYVYMIAKRLGITDYSKIQTYLFFPLAGLKDEDNDDPKKTTEKMMLKTMKQLVFSEQDVKDVITNFEGIIKETGKIDWKNFDPVQNATMSFACSFCGFVGHPKHCPLSYQSNCRFPRKATVMTKEESKKLVKK
jgi:hypothetical protein